MIPQENELPKELPCPHCDATAELTEEEQEFTYKENKVKAIAYFYRCTSCKEEFTTKESDTKTLNQIYDKLHHKK